jgi:hypothetical protein
VSYLSNVRPVGKPGENVRNVTARDVFGRVQPKAVDTQQQEVIRVACELGAYVFGIRSET